MEEKIIVKGELKDVKWVCLAFPLSAAILFGLYDFWIFQGIVNSYYYKDDSPMEAFSYAFGPGNGVNYAFLPAIIIIASMAFIFYKGCSRVQITVTNKRVYGINSNGKRVDLPLDSITAIGTSWLSGLAVTTASGSIKFLSLKNRDELHEAISKLLIERQEKKASVVTQQETPQSNADELKKYKELLDGGIITQQEFENKKKQLLNL